MCKQEYSNSQKLVCGVPQGSVLGAKMYVMYIEFILNVKTLMPHENKQLIALSYVSETCASGCPEII